MKNRKEKLSTILGVQKLLSSIKSRAKLAVLAASLTAMSGVTTAEDIEIYTGVIQSSDGAVATIDSNPDFFPNVLFILDNSTSMGETEPVLDRIVSLIPPVVDDDDDGDGDGDDGDVFDLFSRSLMMAMMLISLCC